MLRKDPFGHYRRKRLNVTILVLFLSGLAGCDNATAPARDGGSLSVAPYQVVKISGDAQQAGPGDTLEPIIVAVRDRSGQPVANKKVTFAITAGNGWLNLERSPASPTYFRTVGGLTDSAGRASVTWWVGRAGENFLTASVVDAATVYETTFRATSEVEVPLNGSFLLTPAGKSVTLSTVITGWFVPAQLVCIVSSGRLSLRPDGTYTDEREFDCEGLKAYGAESGFYQLKNSIITLRPNNGSETSGFEFLYPRYVDGVMSQNVIVFNSFGTEWQYMR
jgi:hypothetical protein